MNSVFVVLGLLLAAALFSAAAIVGEVQLHSDSGLHIPGIASMLPADRPGMPASSIFR